MSEDSPDLFAEDVAVSTTESTDTPETTEDSVKLELPEDDKEEKKETPSKEEASTEEEKEPTEEDKLLKEIEKALEDKEEEIIDEEDEPLLNRLSLKDLTKKYPEILKEFPDIKETVYREKAYTEIFPTVDDAKEASGQLIALHSTMKKAFDGDAFGVLDDLARINQASAVKFVDNILPELHRKTPELFKRAVLPAFRQILVEAHQAGKAANNESLTLAANWLSQYLFNDPNLPQVNFNQVQQQADPERQRLEQELQQTRLATRDSFLDSVNQSNKRYLRDRVAKELGSREQNGLAPYVYDKVLNDCVEAYESLIARDPQSSGVLTNKLREIIQSGNYDNNAKTKIMSAYLGRAKLVIPLIARKKLAEAKGSNVVPIKKSDKSAPSSGKDKSKPRSVKLSELDPSKIDWRKTTDQDLFEDRVTLKK